MTTALIVGAFVLTAFVLVCGGYTISIFNEMVMLRNLYENGFAQLEVQLRRRYDLIPNLVEAARSYLTHEHQTLEDVIAARNQASSNLDSMSGGKSSTSALANLAGAEGLLTGAMGRLSMVIEQYPDLKANATIASLTEELTSTENRIGFARQVYNNAVSTYNIYRQKFPNVLIAPHIGHAEDAALLEYEDQVDMQQAPVVSLQPVAANA